MDRTHRWPVAINRKRSDAVKSEDIMTCVRKGGRANLAAWAFSAERLPATYRLSDHPKQSRAAVLHVLFATPSIAARDRPRPVHFLEALKAAVLVVRVLRSSSRAISIRMLARTASTVR